MEMESGKLFIGGISWDTNEDCLRDYFGSFGEVSEAVVMKDRTTGRARGFGFVVFADPAIAERVVMERHVIDGRTVEAKKAVPRDDQNILNRNNTNICGSPGPARTRKIFVGGLASTVTENDLKNYFDQFGTITDVVVMYDHNTQRPRGFGFITYDSEEAVEKVLYKTFHELNGKMVEVKKAVPKELSPGPGRYQPSPHHHGLARVNSFLNGFTQGFKPGTVGGYKLRTESRFSPAAAGGNCSPFGPEFGMSLDFGTGLTPSYGERGNLRSSTYIGNLNGYSNENPTGYGVGNRSLISLSAGNLWGNRNYNHLSNRNYNCLSNSSHLRAFAGSGSINAEMGSLYSSGEFWDSSNSGHGGTVGSISTYGSQNLDNGIVENGFCSVGVDMERNDGTGIAHESSYQDAFSFGDPTWRLSISDLYRSAPYINRLGNAASVVMSRNAAGYVGRYDIVDKQSDREIAT